MSRKLTSWLQLLRVPNLFTVPGDPLAGFLLASAGSLSAQVFWAIGAALCFYCAGLLINDLKDFEEDSRDRASRPLPSGGVGKEAAVTAGIALFLGGAALAAVGGWPTLRTALALGGLVLFYDLWAKSVPVLGPLIMGLCRGASLLLGAGFAKGMVWWPAFFLVAYIAAVTHLARSETSGKAVGREKWLPLLVLVLGVPRFTFSQTALVIFFGTLLVALATLRKTQTVGPSEIGVLIRLLLPIQAALCASAGGVGLWVALLLLALWPISRIVGSRFYAS